MAKISKLADNHEIILAATVEGKSTAGKEAG